MSSQPVTPGAGGRPQPPRVDARYLRVYLNDHLAVSEGIGGLTRRMSSAARWAPQRAQLAPLVDAMRQDAADLEGVLHGRALKPNPVKRLLAAAGERAGRAKGNGRVLRSSPLARVMELEGLLVGLAACMAPWQTLLELGVETERATAALERLERARAAVEPLAPQVRASSFAD